MAEPPFVPTGFEPPTPLASGQFRLEPLGPQHNEADHAAWTSSIAHIRSTPGFPDGNWPLDVRLADTVASWVAAAWPWERMHRPGR